MSMTVGNKKVVSTLLDWNDGQEQHFFLLAFSAELLEKYRKEIK